MDWLGATAVSLIVAGAGYFARALSGTGAVAALGVGIAILHFTGWAGAAVLGTFFVGSSLISQITARRRPSGLDTKGDRRDAWQVLSNGGPAALGAATEMHAPGLGLLLVAASLSAAAADTWATSLGGLSRSEPRDILRWRRVPAGTSGGVTALGTVGGVLGALVVSGVTAAVSSLRVGSVVLGIGVLGMVVDSLLGAGLQGTFFCEACRCPTEQPVHRCGRRARRVRGLAWLNNDGVNLMTTAGAGFLAWLLR
jgi:uncharacterized protein (TIGR00297 family)